MACTGVVYCWGSGLAVSTARSLWSTHFNLGGFVGLGNCRILLSVAGFAGLGAGRILLSVAGFLALGACPILLSVGGFLALGACPILLSVGGFLALGAGPILLSVGGFAVPVLSGSVMVGTATFLLTFDPHLSVYEGALHT
jgi:hypothetical protein